MCFNNMTISSITSFIYTHKKKVFLTVILQAIITALIYKVTPSSNVFFASTTNVTPSSNVFFASTKNVTITTKINCSNINKTGIFKEQRTLLLNKTTNEELEIALKDQNIQNGGCWTPTDCIPKNKNRVAIIIPYRDRAENLNIFLLNMHPLFAKQKLSYCIYLVEPIANITFNRGILMNIGFVESNKDSNDTWDCHAFHDVDMISENEYTPYDCPDNPVHLVDKVNKWNYQLVYNGFFGGGSLMRKEHYIQVNGYSNLFFGWGGEDDDHGNRIRNSGLKIERFSDNAFLGRYTTLGHASDNPNPERFKILQQVKDKGKTEGLNSLTYDVIKTVKTQFYTKFYVFYNKELIFHKNKK